jgi:hypothetical protein
MDLATIQIKVDTRQVKAANEDIKQLGTTGQMTSKKVNAANDDMAKSAKSTTSAFKLLGGAMAALGVGALVSSFAQTVTESERLKGSLKTMTGSTEDAAFAFAELEKFASQTPFTLDQSVEGFIKLKALGLDPSERALRSYGNTSAAMGKDMMQMVEAVADAATGEFERLKEFGIKASKQGDDVSLTFQGVTTTIGNSSAEIQEYLLQIGETQFGSAMEDQMAALPGLLSNLSDNVSGLFRKIGDVGGVNLFAGAITAASSVIVGITNNLDILGTGLAAATAGFVAFSVGTNLAAILGGMGKIRAAVLAMNTAIMANPIGFIASAIAIAATAIIMNFDKVKAGAERAAIYIQIAFEKLNIFLLEAVGGALNSIMDMFTGVQNRAIATMAAVAAAVKNPTDAFNTFNETYSTTLEGLKTGSTRTNIYATSIAASRDRVNELNGKLASMNTEVSDADHNYRDAERSLSDYATQIDESAVAANELAAETEAARVKTLELLGEISNETEALTMSNVEIAIRNNLQKAGVSATSELGEQIVEATTKLYAEKDAMDAAADAAKALEKQHDESQKAIEKEAERVAEANTRAFERTRDTISGFFVDTFENGKVNFEKIAASFKSMIIKMLADWAASKIAETMKGTFSGIGSSISSMFSGIFSSITSSIGSLAAKAASILTGGKIGTGAAAVTSAATGAGVSAGTSAATSAAAGAGAGLTVGGALASAGQFVGGMFGAGTGIAAGTVGPPTAAAAAGANLGAMLFNPVTAALAAIAAGYMLDSGGTPTSAAGITMGVTPGMNQNGQNTFAIDEFESGFAPIGFKQNATDAQAAAAIKPIRDLDAIMTEITKSAGYDVNLAGHTFSGVGIEGSGSGTLLGTFIEEGKVKGVSIEKQMDTYAAEWVKAVASRNGISASVISEIVGNGTAEGILQAMGEVLTEHRANTFKSEIERVSSDAGMDTESDSGLSEQIETREEKLAREQANIDAFAQGMNEISEKAAQMRALSDREVGELIQSGDLDIEKAVSFYQSRYPGLTEDDVKASMTAMGLSLPSHRDGLNMVPYDGYVAELHAGERVQTAEQARSSDSVADEMSGLRQSIEEVMIAVARNTSKLYRLNDRWDKNGLPPVRA